MFNLKKYLTLHYLHNVKNVILYEYTETIK